MIRDLSLYLPTYTEMCVIIVDFVCKLFLVFTLQMSTKNIEYEQKIAFLGFLSFKMTRKCSQVYNFTNVVQKTNKIIYMYPMCIHRPKARTLCKKNYKERLQQSRPNSCKLQKKARNQDYFRGGVQSSAPLGKWNAWFVYTVVYGFLYQIGNVRYKG